MKAVEKLMVGKETKGQIVVNKTFVQSFYNRRERNIFVFIFENSLNTVGLFFTIAKYIQFVAVFQEIFE